MNKPQICIRLSESLFNELDEQVKTTGTSKTKVGSSAIAQYLGCVDQISMNQRMAELEKKVKELEVEARSKAVSV